MLYGIVFLLLIYFFYIEHCICMYISYIKNENTVVLSFHTWQWQLVVKNCVLETIKVLNIHLQDSPRVFLELTFFTHIVLSSVFYRGCWRTSMSCFTAAHSRGKQWWLQIWSSCCKFLTMVGPCMHVLYLNPFTPQYPHTNSPDWSPYISFKN